jgi:hypothetical protein
MEFPIRQVGDHRPNKQVLLTGQHCRIPICRSRAVSGPYINRVVRSSVIAPGVHYFRRNQVSAAPTKTETAHLSRNTIQPHQPGDCSSLASALPGLRAAIFDRALAIRTSFCSFFGGIGEKNCCGGGGFSGMLILYIKLLLDGRVTRLHCLAIHMTEYHKALSRKTTRDLSRGVGATHQHPRLDQVQPAHRRR